MGELPQGWIATTLAEIGSWCSGGTPSRRKPEYFGKGVPWVKSGDLPDGLILKTEEEITETGLNSSSAKLLPAGAISMALYGATIGKLGVMTFPAATNQACANLIPNENLVATKYAFFYLLSEKQTFIELGQGGAQPNISQEIVRKHPVPLPPLNEQRRIVAKLEEVLARVDASQQRLVKIPVILKRFRQAVLEDACSGRLTADWREENHPSPGASRHPLPEGEGKLLPLDLPPLHEGEGRGEGEELPDGWTLTTLGKLTCPRGQAHSIHPRQGLSR